MFAFAGNLVSGVSNAVYSTIFGADAEPTETTELEVNQPEIEPKTSTEQQTIPLIENLQINTNSIIQPSRESSNPINTNSIIQPSPRDLYIPTFQSSPRTKIDTPKNFDLRTKNFHAALTSPSALSSSYSSPQKSAFKRTDSPSRGISSQIPVHLVYASPVTRPQATYPPNYDSPKKRIYEQTPEKFEDSYKKIKFENSPRRGPYGSYSASYNNSYNTSYNEYGNNTPIDSPRTKKHSRDHSNSSNLTSSANETESKKMKHESDLNISQSKRANPVSPYSLNQVLSKDRKAELSYCSEDDDDIRDNSNILSLSNKPLSQKTSPVLSASSKSVTKTKSSIPSDLPYDSTPSSPLVSSLMASTKRFSTLPSVLPKATDSYKSLEDKSEKNSLFGSSNQSESRSSVSAERDTRSMSLDPIPPTSATVKASKPSIDIESTAKTPIEASTPPNLGSSTQTEPIIPPSTVNFGALPGSPFTPTFGSASQGPSTVSFGTPAEKPSPQSSFTTPTFATGIPFGTSGESQNQDTTGTQAPITTFFGSPEPVVNPITSKDPDEKVVNKERVRYQEKQGDDYIQKGNVCEVRILENLEGKFRTVVHENDTVFTSIPINATLNIKKDSKTIQFDGFKLVFPSVKACDDLFDEFNDSIKAVSEGKKSEMPTTVPDTSSLGVKSSEVPVTETPTQPSTFAFGAPSTQPTTATAPLFGSLTQQPEPQASALDAPNQPSTFAFGTPSTQPATGATPNFALPQPAITPSTPTTAASPFVVGNSTPSSGFSPFGTSTQPATATPLFATPITATSVISEAPEKNDAPSLFTQPSVATPSFVASASSSPFGATNSTGFSAPSTSSSPFGAQPETPKQPEAKQAILPDSQPSAFSFGAPSTQPTTGANPNFALPQPAITPSTPTQPFGSFSASPFSQPNTGAPSLFGSSSTPSSAFGMQTTPPTVPSTSGTPSMFGASSNPPSSAFPPSNSQLTFAMQATSTAPTALGTPSLFGTPSSTPFSMETNTPSTPTQSNTFGSFGASSFSQPNTGAPSLFGSSSTPSPAFGMQTTPSAVPSTSGTPSMFGASNMFSTPSMDSTSPSTSGSFAFGTSASNLTNSKSSSQKPSSSQPAFSLDNNNNNNNNNLFTASASNLFTSQSAPTPSFLNGAQNATSNSMFSSSPSTPSTPNPAFAFGTPTNNNNNSNTSFGTQSKSNISSSSKGKLGSKPSTPTQIPSSPFGSEPNNSPFGNNNNNNDSSMFGSSPSNPSFGAISNSSDMDMGDSNNNDSFSISNTSAGNNSSSDAFSISSSSSGTQTKPAASGTPGRKFVSVRKGAGKK